jgi:hypothetical protein
MATETEQTAYTWMQARLIALLLRHDERGFRRYYAAHEHAPQQHDDALRPYRDLGVIFFLRDELFEHILPRIVRRLSFESPRTLLIEEPPTRGRIDWERTLDATWAERPGEPPLLLHTRQRRRDFATPENLLTVATLLEYRADVQRLLWGEQSAVGALALRHPLNEIVERCDRELAFPQFAGLRSTVQRLLETDGVDELEAQVQERLLPGGNSAYQELLAWRRRLRQLRLLQRADAPQPDDTLGADPQRDNYLYQLWIFYELADLLHTLGRLDEIDTSAGRMSLRFSWGEDGMACRYELRHDQGVPEPVVRWQGRPNAKDVPGVRPDFYLRRIEPQPQRVKQDGVVYWREPGVVWDAKYYRERESERTPSSPVKRMIADLHLLGEPYGVLLFAFMRVAPTGTGSAAEEAGDSDEVLPAPSGIQRISTRPGQDQSIAPDVEVAARPLCPAGAADAAALEQTLTDLLRDAHARLRQPRVPRCHGIFLDALSATAHGQLAATAGLRWRDGTALDVPLDELVLCPKPHIAPWRVDLVSLSRDCCNNAAVCHIKGMQDARKPQRLTAIEEIAEAIRAGSEADDESVADIATRQVLAITKRYAQLLQPDIGHYKQWVHDELEVGELFTQTSLLTESQRETMALARFLWEQIEHIRASNFAGPTLLFTGVLEELTRATIFRQSGKLYGNNGQPLYDTLGTLGNCKLYGGTNWGILERVIVQEGHWREQTSARQPLSFSDWIDMIQKIAYIRNDAAHKANVERRAFQRLIQLYFGGSLSGMGVFNGLLLAWTQQLDVTP